MVSRKTFNYEISVIKSNKRKSNKALAINVLTACCKWRVVTGRFILKEIKGRANFILSFQKM